METRTTRRQLLQRGLAWIAAGSALSPLARSSRVWSATVSAGAVVDVRSHGARGNGIADDTMPVQAAIDRVRDARGGTVLFPPGTYLITTLRIYPGITYLGDRAVLKRPNDPQNVFRRGMRTMTSEDVPYAGPVDSPPLILRGLTFDGNAANQGPGKKQAHLVFLGASGTQPGRLRALIEDCTFLNSPADALTIYRNVDATVRRCTAHNCRRGGLVINGGYTRVAVSDFRVTAGAYRPRIDMEIAGPGFGGSRAVDLLMERVYAEGNVELDNNGGRVMGRNLELVGDLFFIDGHGTGRTRIENSTIGVGGSQFNRISTPGSVEFDRCRFVAARIGDARPSMIRAAHIIWTAARRSARNQLVQFSNCTFTVDVNTVPTQDALIAIASDADPAGSGNRLIVDGGIIAPSYDLGLHMGRGGTWAIRGTDIRSAKALRLNAPAGFPCDVTIDNVLVGGRPYSRRISGERISFEYP